MRIVTEQLVNNRTINQSVLSSKTRGGDLGGHNIVAQDYDNIIKKAKSVNMST